MSEDAIEKSIKSIIWSILDIVVGMATYALAAWFLCSLWSMVPQLVPGVSKALEMVPSITFTEGITLVFFSKIVFGKVFRKDVPFSEIMNEQKTKGR